MLFPESLLRLLSYFVVIPGRRVHSTINGRLEVNYANGKKMLDSSNTNYSYGSLQQLLRYGLRKMDLSAVSSVLLLGLGGGCVIRTLREDFGFQGPVTGVDVDPVIIDLASTEYGLKDEKNVSIVCKDALDFLLDTDHLYDLIIIDLFVDKDVPQLVFNPSFPHEIHAHLTVNGRFILNAGFNHQSSLIIPFIRDLSSLFSIEEFSGPDGVNTLVTGCRL